MGEFVKGRAEIGKDPKSRSRRMSKRALRHLLRNAQLAKSKVTVTPPYDNQDGVSKTMVCPITLKACQVADRPIGKAGNERKKA
jgi:uncharacterized protein (DUF3084 family)